MTDSETMICRLAPGGSQTPFFVLPATGSTPLSLARLARTVGTTRPVYSFEYAGMLNDQPIQASIEDMASSYANEVRKVQPVGPYLLGGHCLGGTIAYAIGEKLEAEGEVVALVVLLESIPPLKTLLGDDRFRDDASRLRETVDQMNDALRGIFEHTENQLQRLPDELIERTKELYWIHSHASGYYEAKPLNSKILLLHTHSHPSELFYPWKALGADFSEHTVPGDTYSILRHPHLARVATILNDTFSDHDNRAL